MVDISKNWITTTPKLLEGISIINTVEDTKYDLLLNRLFTSIQNQTEPFTEEELKKLETTFKLPEDKLKLTLTSLAYIIKRSTQFIIKPTVLQEELTETLKFTPAKSEIFIKQWTELTKSDFPDLHRRQKLDKISWELNLEVASDINVKKTVPTTLFQFDVSDNDGKKDKITIDMNEEQLTQLYNQIENIQTVLDSLNKQ